MGSIAPSVELSWSPEKEGGIPAGQDDAINRNWIHERITGRTKTWAVPALTDRWRGNILMSVTGLQFAETYVSGASPVQVPS